jgi:uncharacterized iron-regulated membrane protein
VASTLAVVFGQYVGRWRWHERRRADAALDARGGRDLRGMALDIAIAAPARGVIKVRLADA